MPRRMDERFKNPSDGENETDLEGTAESASKSVRDERNDVEQAETQSRRKGSTDQENVESSSTTADGSRDEPLNIREDWDSATIYVEPEQSEDIEVTFARLKKQLKREGVILKKQIFLSRDFRGGLRRVSRGDERKDT